MKLCNISFKAKKLTPDNYHHFFGYYDKCAWNMSQKYILAHRVSIDNTQPANNDQAVIGIVPVDSSGSFQPLAQTYAWCWQQGAMLQWHPAEPENTIIYNDRKDNQFVSVINNIQTGNEKVLPLPVAAVSRDGKKALSLNFARLNDVRPGYGYEGIKDKYENELASDKDGIRLLDLETGKDSLIISLAQIVNIHPLESMKMAKHWFNHLLFSPDNKRFIFLHRWKKSNSDFHATRMFTANTDGSDIYLLNDDEMTSHFDWKNNNQVVAFARRFGYGDKYFLFNDKSQETEVLGDEKLTALYDGHCNYSPNSKWLLTDTYPNAEGEHILLLYNESKDLRVDILKLKSENYIEPARCDLHPSWSRDGQMICFDSSDSGKRQIYTVDVSSLINDNQVIKTKILNLKTPTQKYKNVVITR